ncbi:hypothetical protein ABH926_008234 [Catenulispora sp. GP43]|uniref:hypothetical protein n=1 Tax=Catenulispora sp. GP43 TaxID=3156263 RepID=UPI0035140E07
MNEYEIRDLLGQGIGEEPPVVGGPAAVFAGARARVVRTRAVTGALSVVAVLGVTAGAVAFSGGAGRPEKASVGAAGATSPSTSATPGLSARPPSTTPPPTTTAPPNTTTPTPLSQLEDPGLTIHRVPAPQPGAGRVLIDGRSTAAIVKLLLPSGLVTANYGGQDSYRPTQLGVETIGYMSVDDGSGKLTALSAHVAQNSPGITKVTDCTTEQELNPGQVSDCEAVVEPDGSVVLSYRQSGDGRGVDSATAGAYVNEATRVFQNGTVLSINATNFYSPPNQPLHPVTPSRKDSLLSIDQLVAMVMDAQWGLTVPAQVAQQAKQSLVPYIDNTQH